MREFLFRGQTRRKGQKVWMDGTPVDSNWVEGYGVCVGKGDFSVIYAGSPVEKFTVYTDTVGQFTGLTDKNGKKIFEGDIVATAWDRGVVSYGEFNCSCCDGVFGWSFGNADIRDYDRYEVIGNIHDNPELLGGTDHGQ